MTDNKSEEITANNFWNTDLDVMEASFLPEGKVITDMPVREHELSKILKHRKDRQNLTAI